MTIVRCHTAVWIVAALSVVCSAGDERHVPLEGQSNFRDVGGYKTVDGSMVKRGQVFRSGELSRLTDQDVARMEELGVQTVFNFLTEKEIEERGPDRLPPGTRQVALPIDTDDGLAGVVSEARKTADFSKVPASLNPELHRLLIHDGRKQYAALLKEIANSDGPLVYHCSHGVHRTGTATAVLLWTLGVPWETVREDYLLSNKYRRHEVEQRLAQLRELAAKNRNVAPDRVDMTDAKAFYVLQAHYIDAARDEILKEFGSIDRYLTDGLGISSEGIRKLRNRLLK